jgi:hypothetical protein
MGAPAMIRETEADRAAQEQLRRRIELAYRVTLYPLGPLAPADYLGVRDDGQFSVWEIKSHTANSTIPRVIIDAAKVLKVREAAARLGPDVPPLVVFGFGDGGARLLHLGKTAPDQLAMNGRTDRHDPNDWDPVCWFRVDEMQVIP